MIGCVGVVVTSYVEFNSLKLVKCSLNWFVGWFPLDKDVCANMFVVFVIVVVWFYFLLV